MDTMDLDPQLHTPEASSLDLCPSQPPPPHHRHDSPPLLLLPPPANSPSNKVPVSVEVCLKSTSAARHDDVRLAVERMLEKRSLTHANGLIPVTERDDPFLLDNVASICISDTENEGSMEGGQRDNTNILLFWQISLNIFVYQLNDDGAGEEMNDDEDIASFQDWALPAKEFHGLWESLIFDADVKQRLVRYAEVALLFADKSVNSNLVSWNRVILLHGPPGTGKTSLCKVTKLFQKIHSFLEEDHTLIFLLIDEVESLASARQAALSGSEPSDSIRVVNALLTQLDRLKSCPNVFVLTTSNITGAIDIAFVDRADIKAYVGPPSLAARYEILRSCVKELYRVGLLTFKSQTDNKEAMIVTYDALNSSGQLPEAQELSFSRSLLIAAQISEGLSGRTLRKLPFLAYASMPIAASAELSRFLLFLEAAAKKEVAEFQNVQVEG